MTTEQRLYLNSVRAAFPTFSKDEQRFFIYFKNNVKDYISINKSCSNDDLTRHFGSPEAIVDSFYETNSVDLNSYSKKSYHNTSIIIIISIITIGIILLVLISAFNQKQSELPRWSTQINIYTETRE